MPLHRVVTRLRLVTSDDIPLLDREMAHTCDLPLATLPRMATRLLVQFCKRPAVTCPVYHDEYKDFMTVLDNTPIKWKAMQSQTRKTIDTDLSVIHRLENQSTKCQIQAGRLAVEMGSNQLHLDVPALSVVYENSQQNSFHVDTFCVPVTTDMDKTLYMQCLLFSQDKQVLNPHTLLRAHVPVSTILSTSLNASHRDVRILTKQHHKRVLCDLGLQATDGITQFTVKPYHVQWTTRLSSEHFLTSVYLKM